MLSKYLLRSTNISVKISHLSRDKLSVLIKLSEIHTQQIRWQSIERVNMPRRDRRSISRPLIHRRNSIGRIHVYEILINGPPIRARARVAKTPE